MEMEEEANLPFHSCGLGAGNSVQLHHETVPFVFSPPSCLTQLSVESDELHFQLCEAARLALQAVATC